MVTTTADSPTTAPAQRSYLALAFFAVVILAHLPFLIAHMYNKWPQQHYQYLPLVPFGAAALASRRLSGFTGGESSTGFMFWWNLFLGLSVFSLALVIFSPNLAPLALVLNLGAAARLAGGPELAQRLRPAILFLLLMTTLLEQDNERLLQRLQISTVKGSTAIYEWGGGLCLVKGATVELPDRETPLFVADACSGIQSLFAVVTCTVFYLAWYGRGWIHSTLVIVASLFWVMAANIARVLAVINFSQPGGIDLSQGIAHEALGIGTFLVALGLTLSTDRLFLVVNPSRSVPFDEQEEAAEWTLKPPAWAAIPVAAILLVLGSMSFLVVTRAAGNANPSLSFKFDISPVSPNFLPDAIDEWRLIRFDGVTKRTDDDNMAARSQTWHYTNGQIFATVSLDYPYPSIHDLQGCYQNIGWEMEARYIEDVPPAFVPPAGNFVRLKLVRGKQPRSETSNETVNADKGEEFAYVAYSAFTIDGQPERSSDTIGFMDMIRSRADLLLAKLGRTKAPKLRQPVYQIQVICQSPLPWTPAQVEQLDRFFLSIRKNMVPPKLEITR